MTDPMKCAVCGEHPVGTFPLCGVHGRYGGVDLVPASPDLAALEGLRDRITRGVATVVDLDRALAALPASPVSTTGDNGPVDRIVNPDRLAALPASPEDAATPAPLDKRSFQKLVHDSIVMTGMGSCVHSPENEWAPWCDVLARRLRAALAAATPAPDLVHDARCDGQHTDVRLGCVVAATPGSAKEIYEVATGRTVRPGESLDPDKHYEVRATTPAPLDEWEKGDHELWPGEGD